MNETLENVVPIGRRLIDEVLTPMKHAFVGKDEIIDLMGICLVAGENLFLLGPPGTAKSALVVELTRRLHGKSFEYLLTRFTEPNEIFGPFDIGRLREGEMVTNTQGMLPEASLVFLDELLNANSAILNALLGVLNERVFRRGKEIHRVPTLMVVGASNHLPEDEALQALFDRFLMRVICDAVPGDQLAAVVEAGWLLDQQQELETKVSIEDLRRLNAMLPQVDVSKVREDYVDMILRMRKAGIEVSDRRAVKLQRLMAASALLCGRTEVVRSDLWVCRNIWDRVEQQEVLRSVVNEMVEDCEAEGRHPAASPDDRVDAEGLARDLEFIRERIAQVERDSAEFAQLKDRLSILASSCHWVKDDDQRGFLAKQIDGLWEVFEATA